MRDDLKQKFTRYLARTSDEPIGIVVERAEGCWIYSKDGNRYLDFISGIAVTNIGHRHPEVVQAIKGQVDRYLHAMVYGEFIQDVQIALAEKLVTLVQEACRRANGKVEWGWQYYPTNSGTEANEGALKLARKFTGRKKFIAFKNSFHGDTMGSLSVTGREVYRRPFEPLLNDVEFLPFGDINALERIDEKVAAVISEPIQGEAGIIVPPDDFLPALRERCDEVGALLILDEVQTGMGRTGKLFAFQHYGVQPDIFTLAKSIAGGFPMGAMLAKPEWAELFQPGTHASTFGGNYLACAAALAVLEALKEEHLIENAQQMGDYLMAKLKELNAPIKEVRGKGLMVALEFSEPIAPKVRDECLKAEPIGLVVNAIGDYIIRFLPPLTVTAEEIDQAIDIFQYSISSLQAS